MRTNSMSDIKNCFLVFCASLLVARSCQGSKHVALFIFGDSLYDAGNNKYIEDAPIFSDFWPYGETFFKHPTGRPCDGRLIPDFIAEYANLPLIPPYLQPGNNQFMEGENFESKGDRVLAENLQGMEIYKIGGRKFGLSTLIALGCLPSLRAVKQEQTGVSGCMDEATLFAKLHNRALSKALEELERQLEGFRYSNFDAYIAGGERINNPSKYGFKEVREACCGNGPYKSFTTCGQKGYQLCENASEYFFFDSAHPTECANNQFAKLMWSGNLDIVKPYNLKTLFEE